MSDFGQALFESLGEALQHAKGAKTYEQAIAGITRTQATAALRYEMKIRKIKVRARKRGVDAKLAQVKARVEFDGPAPVHLRSRAAQALRRKAEKPARIPSPGQDPELTGAGVPMVDLNRNRIVAFEADREHAAPWLAVPA